MILTLAQVDCEGKPKGKALVDTNNIGYVNTDYRDEHSITYISLKNMPVDYMIMVGNSLEEIREAMEGAEGIR